MFQMSATKLLEAFLKNIMMWGENTSWWPKNVVTNIVFQNYAIFNFHQVNIKRAFHKLY
jgi:hypothetical protein